MNADTVQQPKPYGVRIAVALLIVQAPALIILFWPECRAAVLVWINSTAYGHCFLVIPIIIYLIWDRRESLRGMTPEPTPILAVLCVPLSFVWFAAERLGIMEGRQLIFILMIEVLFLATLGWNLFHMLMGPLIYMIFLVPFGTFLTPMLQNFTADFIDVGLTLLGIPHFVTAMVIEIGAGTFYVAEACAGLRFLIASIAFGVFFALLNYRSPGRRCAFILASILIPIIANGFRALGIVVLGHVLGSAEAAAADHILYGWIFFSIVMLFLVAVGLPFREPPGNVAFWHRKTSVPSRQPWAAFMVLLFAAIGPVAAWALNTRSEIARLNGAPAFTALPGCTFTAPDSATLPPDRYTTSMVCQSRIWTVSMQVVPTKSTAAQLNEVRNHLVGPLNYEETVTTSLPNAPGWQAIVSREPPQITVISSWLDGQLNNGGMRQRFLQAYYSILGSEHQPLLMAVTTKSPRVFSESEGPSVVLDASRFLTLQTDLAKVVAGISSK